MITQNILDFYSTLKENNNKEWFDENRKWYESVKKEYHDITENILNKMKLVDDSLINLSVKDCIFRINRDIRFSKDKSPYKTNIGMFMTPFGKKLSLAGYYIHIEQGASFAGGGLYMPMADALKKVRKEIHYNYKEFEGILSAPSFRKYYNGLDDEPGIKLSKPPKDYTADDPAIEYLKYKSFTAVTPLSDQQIMSEDFTNKVSEILNGLKPFIHYLNSALLTNENGEMIIP